MGQKKAYTLLDGVTATGASSEIEVGNYQKSIVFHIKGASTPNAVVAIQIEDPDGDWESIDSQTITAATTFIQLDNQPFKKFRANITSYTTGTFDVFAYVV